MDRSRLGMSAGSALRPSAVEAVAALATPGRPVSTDDQELMVRFDASESAAAYWQELGAQVAELSGSQSLPASAVSTGWVTASDVLSISNTPWWVELSIPPAPGTRWSVLTASAPVDAGKAVLSFDYVDRFAPEGVLMSSRGSDCITASTSWWYDERQFRFDFSVTVEPATSDSNELARCLLCTDNGGGLDVTTHSISFTGGRQRQNVSVTGRRTGRLWHDGPCTLRFERCEITVV